MPIRASPYIGKQVALAGMHSNRIFKYPVYKFIKDHTTPGVPNCMLGTQASIITKHVHEKNVNRNKMSFAMLG